MSTLEVVTLVVAIIGAIGTIFGIFGISAYLTERAKHKANKINKAEDEEEAKKAEEAKKLKTIEKKEFEDSMRNIVREELQSVCEDLSEVKRDLSANTVGTVTILRDRMKAILDDCRDNRGFASPSTKANWHELYNTYGELGGNHFKEYVDQWKEEIENLPTKPRKRRVKKENK